MREKYNTTGNIISSARITFIVIMILFILGIIGIGWMLVDYTQEQQKCAKEFGGQIKSGYCIYVENGTSKSYHIIDSRVNEGKQTNE